MSQAGKYRQCIDEALAKLSARDSQDVAHEMSEISYRAAVGHRKWLNGQAVAIASLRRRYR